MSEDATGEGPAEGNETDTPIPYEIDRPQVADIPELLGLWQAQYNDHYSNYPGQYAPFTDELRARVEAHLHEVISSDETHVFAARQGDRLVGFVDFGVENDDYFDAAVTRYGVVKEVFTSEDARRQGIGAALTTKARDFLLNDLGMTHVKIQYAASNKAARRTYASMGFVPAQEIAIFTKPEA